MRRVIGLVGTVYASSVPRVIESVIEQKDDRVRLGEAGAVIPRQEFEELVAAKVHTRIWPGVRHNPNKAWLLLEHNYHPIYLSFSKIDRILKRFVREARKQGYRHLENNDLEGAIGAFDQARMVSNEVDDVVRVWVLTKEPVWLGWLNTYAPEVKPIRRGIELKVLKNAYQTIAEKQTIAEAEQARIVEILDSIARAPKDAAVQLEKLTVHVLS